MPRFHWCPGCGPAAAPRSPTVSREFGSFTPGYFHDQVRQAADDCLEGAYPLTRLWGEFLAALAPVAYAVSSAEAGDSAADYPAAATATALPALKAALAEVERFVTVPDGSPRA